VQAAFDFANHVVMLIQFLVGAIVSLCNITIHALVMTAVVRVARASSAKKRSRPSLLLITTMIATVSVLMAAHVVEVFVWSLTYLIVGAVTAESNLVYFAFVSYATLGYGDVLPVERWQLLGPIAAMNGALLFGWSTAVIFDVLQKTMRIYSDTAASDSQ
jgi:Ion channel